jgi:hypothetical protein
MKISRKDANCKPHARPILRFESHQLTAFAGIVLLQELFRNLNLLDRLKVAVHSAKLTLR